MVKTADRSTASPHQEITYSYTVTNTSPVELTNISLNDDKLGAISLSGTNLGPGDNVTAQAKYSVTVNDLPGPITNIATVEGYDPEGQLISGTSSQVSVNLTTDNNLLTKFEILFMRGVPGKGIATAPGLQKPFNPNSQAAENAGKKSQEEEQHQEQENNQGQGQNQEHNQHQEQHGHK